MQLEHLWLTDFRNYRSAELVPAGEGLTVVVGANGQGKTNLLEAVGYLATTQSFRGAPADALVRVGADHAVVRATGRREERSLLIEAVLHPTGRDRIQVNRQPLRRARDLLGALCVTVFSPEDLSLVKGPPQHRRDYLDGLLISLHPRHDATQAELDRVLKQRNALLKSAGGTLRPDPDVARTLDVWDAKLAETGERLVTAREALTSALGPLVADAYGALAETSPGSQLEPDLCYRRSWDGPLLEALRVVRPTDLRRGVTTVGPQRDELALSVGGLPARTHCSQGEQRSLALALRLAGHHLVTARVGSAPVLLLDDVFSELDPRRADALLRSLPPGQAVLTTAGALPPAVRAAVTVMVAQGRLVS